MPHLHAFWKHLISWDDVSPKCRENRNWQKNLHQQSFLMKCGWWLPVKQNHPWTLRNSEDFKRAAFIPEMRNQRLQNTAAPFPSEKEQATLFSLLVCAVVFDMKIQELQHFITDRFFFKLSGQGKWESLTILILKFLLWCVPCARSCFQMAFHDNSHNTVV